MHWIKLIPSYFVLINIVQTFARMQLTDVVQTNNGPVRGRIVRTVQNNVKYSAFEGIPYGKPPISHLRFRAPVEADRWIEPLLTTSLGSPCPQMEFFSSNYRGNEDCLYLNVRTPKTKFGDNVGELLAVMIWIHGGGFVYGTGGYHADFLIEENVVVVSMNYRLGALGFLSLNHPNVTGNAGLKDQVFAMKWVQQNIKNFGGDPNKVTIFGQSSGAASVEFHKLSNLSKGLFHRSIAMSGSALNPWAFSSRRSAVAKAFLFGAKLGIYTNRKDKLIKKLYKTSAEHLTRTAMSMIQYLVDIPFKATYEDETVANDEVFVTECSIDLYKSGNYTQLPHIMGFTKNEAIHIVAYHNWTNVGSIYDPIISSRTFTKILHETSNDAINYLDDNNNHNAITKLINIVSDIVFVVDIDRTQRYLAGGYAPIYYYRNSFDYDSSLHKIAGIALNGTAHADDVAHIFWVQDRNQSLDATSDIAQQRKRMARMWTNFAKYGDPTPHRHNDRLLNVTWIPSDDQGLHLEIGNGNLLMGERPISELVERTQGLIKRHEKVFNGCRKSRN